MTGKTRQVIIGNSGAGLSALKAIRQIDADCPITVITDQTERAYSPVLTTYYIAGKVPREKLFITDGAFYSDLGVDLVAGKRAEAVDTASQKVILEDGSKIDYDNLLIATGASAKKLTIPGGDLPQVRTLRTLEDAEAISDLAQKGVKDIVVLGAGLVSLQTADAVYAEGMNLTFLVGSNQVLSQNVDKSCAEIVKAQLESKKAVIHFGTDAEAIEENKGRAVVVSKTGEKYPADVVIVGKGVDPNVQPAQEGGIAVNRGILVDEYMRAGSPNVYAAGDVAEGPSFHTGQPEVMATWYNACNQGRIAGMNMAGKEEPFIGGLNRNITSVFDTTVASVGAVKGLEGGDAEEIVIDRAAEGIYRKLLLQDDVVQGAVLMGRINDAGMALNLIQKRVKISPRREMPDKSLMDLRQVYCAGVNPSA